MTGPVKREAILLAAMLALGALVLPLAVYAVGAQLIGEYRPGADAVSLVADLWAALASGHWAAWLLVASPYLVVQALRAARALWRSRPSAPSAPSTANADRHARNWRV